MKAIKIASGVAITALAAAISAQASAAAHGGETETTFSYSGAMEVQFIADMEAETKDVELADEDEDLGDGGWGLALDIDVTHGPFSGTIGIENENGTNSVTAGDIVITDGNISFGQVGSVIETDEYAYDQEENARGVDAGFRYSMEGLQVQLEGLNDATVTDYGLGAAYTGSADALSYAADFQFRASDDLAAQDPDNQPFVYAGVGATYEMDMVTAKAAFNYFTVDDQALNDASDSEYALSLSSTFGGLTVGAQVQDTSIDNADGGMQYKVDGSYGIDAITLSAYYEGTQEDGGDEAQVKAEYAQDRIGAYAKVTLGNLDLDTADEPKIGTGVNYTQDNGVEYAADYTFQTDATNELVLSAAYSF